MFERKYTDEKRIILLIVPVGIEMLTLKYLCVQVIMLLIVPVGIEMDTEITKQI